MNPHLALFLVLVVSVPHHALARLGCSGPFLFDDKKDTTVAAFDVPPKVLVQSSVTYPESAKRDKLEGDVVLMVTITEAGKVSDVSVKRGVRKDLDDAAAASARGWTFEPAQRGGKPVRAVVALPFRFRLDDSKKTGQESAEAQEGSMPKLIKTVNPEYPKEAARQKIEGTVHVEMLVDGQGHVVQARLIKEVHPLLDGAALAAARKWEFDTSDQERRSVVAPFRFKLSEEK